MPDVKTKRKKMMTNKRKCICDALTRVSGGKRSCHQEKKGDISENA